MRGEVVGGRVGDVCGGGSCVVSVGDVFDGIVILSVVVLHYFSGDSGDLSGTIPMKITMWGEVGRGWKWEEDDPEPPVEVVLGGVCVPLRIVCRVCRL